MNPLHPLIGPTLNPITNEHEENRNEQYTRFHRAQARMLFAWRKCWTCGENYREAVGHDCKGKEQS